MKTFLSFIVLLLSLLASSAQPLLRQSFTTSSPPATVFWTGGLVLSNAANQNKLEYTNGVLSLVATNIAGAPTNTGFWLTNSDIAIVGVQKNSPSLYMSGHGWKTTATAGSQPINSRIQLEPVQGTTTPTANLTFGFATNGLIFANMMTLSSAGVLSLPIGTANLTFGANTYGSSFSISGNASIGSSGSFLIGTRGSVSSHVNGVLSLQNNAGTDSYGISFGGTSPTNGLVQFISLSTGNSNGTVNLRSGNTNTWLNFGSENIGTHMTNWTGDTTSFVGFTNTSPYNQIWNIRGTSGNIVFWNRTGLAGSTAAGIAVWTNTIIASGSDIVVGVNCGLAIDTGVGVVGGGRAF